jgi:ATP-dependent RNA helicase SUPV3L1/SUV3
MAVPTIEQFIERSKVNCHASAALTVKRRFLLAHSGEADEEALKAQAAAYLATPEGQAECEAALAEGKFYKLLCAENAAEQPKVAGAYQRYISGMVQPSAADKAERRKTRNKRKKENKKKRDREKRNAVFEKYRTYTITQEDEEHIVSVASSLIEAHYADIENILPHKFLREALSEFVNETVFGKFNRRLYDEAALNKKRIDNVVYMSGMPCGNLNELVMAGAAYVVLSEEGISGHAADSIAGDLLDRYCPRYPRLDIIYARLIKKYDRDTVTGIITGSMRYKKAVEYMQSQIKASESAHQLILKEIPEDVTELYPGARGMRRHFFLHLGPTNSGKTYQSLEACKKAERGVYLAPLRLLAYEICERFNREGVPCRMITGEEEIDVPFATHTSSTVEMLNVNERYDVAVVDECQLIEDEERGGAWTAAILGVMADEIHLCAAENAKKILISLIELCGDSYQIVEHQRSVPLKVDKRDFVFPRDVEKEDALIAFSKKAVLSYAEQLKAVGIKASVIYGDLPYDVRRSEVSRFVHGETDVVVATDAVGMGLNLPIKRVVFLEAYKYDGRRRRFLHGTEVKQIAGRAGRMGMYDIGYFNAAEFKDDICRKLARKSHDIERARLRIPESILAVDMPLSEILLRWGTIPGDEIFTKNTVEREVALSRELEKYSSDKLLIYKFVTIPFSETRKDLYDFWFGLFGNEVNDTRKSVFFYTGAIERRGSELEDHELAYRKCDILYFYYDRFGVKEDLEAIMQLKHEISADIMNILSGNSGEDKEEDAV